MHKLIITLIGFTLFAQTRAQVIPNGATAPAAKTARKTPAYKPAAADNYQRVFSPQKPIQDATQVSMTSTVEDVQVSTQYFDQLGRSLQTVVKQASPGKKDGVAISYFDAFNLPGTTYMPYVATTADGNFKTDFYKEDSTYFKTQFPDENIYYGRQLFDGSPLNRVTAQYAPGNSWNGNSKGITTGWRSNTDADSVRLWQVDISSENDVPYSDMAYADGTLSVQEIIDERGKKVITYTDEQGKTILTKIQLSTTIYDGPTGWLCTYYIYDDINNLRAVLPPKMVNILNAADWDIAANSDAYDNLGYSYWYDVRGRLLMKHIPGKGKIYFAYDVRDRPVMTQDENLRLTNQWTFIKYDAQSRPYKTGLITTSLTKDQVQTNAAASADYPALSGTYTVLTEAYYDDYAWVSSTPLSNSTLVTTNINSTNFITTYNTAPSYAQQITKSDRIRGRVTGTKTMMLGTSNYLYALTLYDEDGRSIQTKQTNNAGGTDVATVQYSFAGRVLRSHLAHQKISNGTQNHTLLTKYAYDHIGRLKTLFKNIDGTGDKAISSMAYDESGQLESKTLGTSLSTQQYSYNIRGWLNGINKDYVENSTGTNPYFGEELFYDFGFTTTQINGNIAGVKWRAYGDAVARAYGYAYDNTNRLYKADFSQQNRGSTAWTDDKMDFSVYGLAYDSQGNLTKLNQRGMKVNTPVTIDSLSYTYLTNSNQLIKVKDYISDDDPWGDFKDTSLTTNDYVYDVNGNIVKDNNKHIHTSANGNGITYNFLDKPDNITVNGKGSIAYVYDATGALLQKTASDTKAGLKTITTYIAGFVYERRLPIAGSGGTDTLQYVLHEEGRIRNSMKMNYSTMAVTFSLEYDYFLKDHLGNIRTTLTEEDKIDAYPAASLETAKLSNEKLYYTSLDGGRISKTLISGYPADGSTNPNDYVQKLNGNETKIGASILLKVMAGDKITVKATSWFNNWITPGAPVSPVTDIVNALTNSLPLASGGKLLQDQLGSTILSGNVNSFLNNRNGGNNASRPKAWFNVVVLDEQLNPVITSDGKNSYFQQVAGSNVFTTHSITDREVTRNGYVYIFVSNETPDINVFFDNLQVTQTRGPVLQESGYYPFGLEMQGISSNAGAGMSNAYKFNGGTLLEDRFDVNLYETPFRRYDAQIGRFTGVDAMAEQVMHLTPYQYGKNDPIYYNDPTGLLHCDNSPTQQAIRSMYAWSDMGEFINGDNFGSGGSSGSSAGGGSSGNASSAADILGQLSKAAHNGISDIIDDNGNSVASVKWNFSKGYATSMMTLANDYNSVTLYNQYGEFNISFNQSEFQNVGYEGLGDGPKISKRSFNFVLTGPNANTRNAKVWGIPAGLYTPEGLEQIIFGLNIYAPIDVVNWGGLNRALSLMNYFDLWTNDDIQSKNINGKTHYLFSRYAQQMISADATDYASYWSSEKALPSTGAVGYKGQFVNHFLEWTRQYMPGTTLQILNTNMPGTTQAIFIP